MQVPGGEAGVRERLADRAHRRVDEVGGQFVEFRPGQGHVEVLRGAGLIDADKGQGDLGGGDAGEVDLRLFRRVFQTLHRHLVVSEVNAVGSLEAFNQPVDDPLVKVVAAQMVVAGGREDFLNALAHLDDRDIEGAAAQVVDHDLLVAFLVGAVSERRRGRFVDDSLDVKAGDVARVLGRLALGVGEVGGAGDNRFGDRLAEISFGVGFQLLQDHRGNLLRGVALAVDRDFIVGTHMPFDRGDGPVGVHNRLPFCDGADHPLAVLREGDDRRGCTHAFVVGDDNRLAVFHDGDAGVGRTKVNTNDFSHK